MDDQTLRKGIQALRWEANYRKKFEADQSVSVFFLAPQSNLDKDFEHFFLHLNLTDPAVLDIGTGTGEQAIFLAKKGWKVTATDVSSSAIKKAREQAAIHEVNVKFIEDNILSTNLTSQFDIIIDRGCFTLIPVEYNKEFLSNVKKLLNLNGWLLIKTDKKKKKVSFLKEKDDNFRIEVIKETNYTVSNNIAQHAVFFALQKIR